MKEQRRISTTKTKKETIEETYIDEESVINPLTHQFQYDLVKDSDGNQLYDDMYDEKMDQDSFRWLHHIQRYR